MKYEHTLSTDVISKTARRIKVGYVRRNHPCPKDRFSAWVSRHPSLILSGDWLAQAGFPTGVIVTVKVEYGKLVLCPEPE